MKSVLQKHYLVASGQNTIGLIKAENLTNAKDQILFLVLHGQLNYKKKYVLFNLNDDFIYNEEENRWEFINDNPDVGEIIVLPA